MAQVTGITFPCMGEGLMTTPKALIAVGQNRNV